MKKTKLYIAIIVLLLILNIFQLGAHFFKRPPNFEPKKIAARELHLDANQEEQFFVLVQKHRSANRELLQTQQALLQTYFAAPIDSLLEKITQLEKNKILLAQNHFAEIKSILRPEQYPHLERFKMKAMQHILQGQGRRKSPRPPRR